MGWMGTGMAIWQLLSPRQPVSGKAKGSLAGVRTQLEGNRAFLDFCSEASPGFFLGLALSRISESLLPRNQRISTFNLKLRPF